jgi:hypothetical protein
MHLPDRPRHHPEDQVTPLEQPRLSDGAVLVRVRADGPEWVGRLPSAPAAWVLTVTVGHPSLLPVSVDELLASGYRIVGVARDGESFGSCVDVFVPAQLREQAPAWWDEMTRAADRIFDLRMGPVWSVLGQELELHLGAAS